MFSELRNILKHSSIYGVGNVLNKALGFFLIPIYTRYLTPAQYGTYSLIELTTFIIEMFLGFGISQSILRFYHEYESRKDQEEVISTSFFMILAICIVGLTPVIFLSEKLSLLVFRTPVYMSFFRIALLSLFFVLAGEIPLTYLRIKEKSVLFTLVSLASTLVGLALNILFIVFLKMQILGILLSVLITTGLTTIIFGYRTFKEVKFRLSIPKSIEIIKYGAPFIPAGIGMFVLHFGDRFFLERYANLTEVGLYSLGYKFGMLLQLMIFAPFMQIWGPKRFEIAKKENAQELIAQVFTYYCFIQIFLGLGIASLIKDVLKIAAGPEFQRAYEIVPIIVLSYLLLAGYYHVQIGILIRKKTKYVGLILTISAISNVLLCRVLIPMYASMGAALATLGSFSIMFCLNYFISRKLYYIPFEYFRILKMLSLSLVIFIVGKQVYIDSIPHSIAVNVMLVLSFPIFLYFLNFYTEKEMHILKGLWDGVVQQATVRLGKMI